MKINFEHLQTISETWIKEQEESGIFYQDYAKKIAKKPGNFLGWIELVQRYPKKVIIDINYLAKNWENKKFDTLVVIGIGGSYLGVKAGQEFLEGLLPANPKIKVYYLGNSMSSEYISQVLAKLSKSNFCINVISKSGTTLEPAFAFHKCVDLLIEKFGKESLSERIIATTDAKKGVLKEYADKNKIPTLIIPDNIGGRYSVLTPVGLLPFKVMGFDIDAILAGAKKMQLHLNSLKGLQNPALKYAVIRNLLLKQNFKAEIFTFFEFNLANMGEWLKQLFGESEGKNATSLWPVSVIYSTDLHSLGQSVQEGFSGMFETFIKFEKSNADVKINSWTNDDDKLNFVSNKSLHEINYSIYEATLSAHKNVPTRNIIEIIFDRMDYQTFGEFVQFYFNACMYSALILGVDPFNQPGVEVYKKNMFTILKNK